MPLLPEARKSDLSAADGTGTRADRIDAAGIIPGNGDHLSMTERNLLRHLIEAQQAVRKEREDRMKEVQDLREKVSEVYARVKTMELREKVDVKQGIVPKQLMPQQSIPDATPGDPGAKLQGQWTDSHQLLAPVHSKLTRFEGELARQDKELQKLPSEQQKQLDMQRSEFQKQLKLQQSEIEKRTQDVEALLKAVQNSRGASSEPSSAPDDTAAQLKALHQQQTEQASQMLSLKAAIADAHVNILLFSVKNSRIALESAALSAEERRAVLASLGEKEQQVRQDVAARMNAVFATDTPDLRLLLTAPPVPPEQLSPPDGAAGQTSGSVTAPPVQPEQLSPPDGAADQTSGPASREQTFEL